MEWRNMHLAYRVLASAFKLPSPRLALTSKLIAFESEFFSKTSSIGIDVRDATSN
jgi:hypothetical protein